MAEDLVKNIYVSGFTKWSKIGIRVHLLNKNIRELVSYLIIEGDSNSLHVLNMI